MRNQEYNLAGKTLVVERVKQLKGSKSDYIRQVTKTAQANKKIDEKETQEFYIKALPSTIERDDVRRDSQTIVLQAIVNGYKDPVPNFEINGLPRMCGYHTGDTKVTLITTLESYITNQTPYTPNFSGTNNWSRGGALFTVGDTVSVGYFCSDNSYVTAIMTVTTVNTSTITGTVNSIVYTLEGFDDRDTTNTHLYIPYAQAVPLNVVLYNGADQMDSIELSVTNNTRHRRTFGVDSSAKGDTYTEGATEYNYIEGDSFVQVSVSGDTKTAVIKVYIQDSWIELNNFPTYSRYDEILTDSLPDVFSVYQAENHVVAAGYDWFKQIIAEHISAVYYFVGGAIYGYGQNGSVDMTQSPGNRVSGDAFIIDADGIIEFSSGFARDMNVRGTLNLYSSDAQDNIGANILHPALTTVTGSAGDTSGGATVNEILPATWNISTLYNNSNITANSILSASGKRNGTAISNVLRLTNTNSVFIAGSSEISVVHRSDYAVHSFQCPQNYGAQLFTITKAIRHEYSWSSETITSLNSWLYINGQLERLFHNTPLPFSITVPAGALVQIGYVPDPEKLKIDSVDVYAQWGDVTYSGAGFSAGFHVKENGVWTNLGTDSSRSELMTLTSPISFYDSGHYQIPTAFLNYTGGTFSMTTGIPYSINSTNLVVDGDNCVGVYFQRNSATSVILAFHKSNDLNITSKTINSGSYHYISGTIVIASAQAGVETMSVYPKSDDVYDLGKPGKDYNYGYINNIVSGSKRSKKKDISVYERNALDILNATEIVRFTYKSDPEERRHIGFIADDTDSDLSGEDHDSFLPNHVISVCVKAIQELSAEVEQLKAERKHNL